MGKGTEYHDAGQTLLYSEGLLNKERNSFGLMCHQSRVLFRGNWASEVSEGKQE